MIDFLQINKQIQMSLMIGKHKPSRAIKRIKIRQNVLTNPEDSLATQKITINRVLTAKELSADDGQKTSPSRMLAQTKDGGFLTQKSTSYYQKSSNRSEQKQTENYVSNKETPYHKIKKQNFAQNSQQKGKIQLNIQWKKQKVQTQPSQNIEKKGTPNRNIHMNYKEYEELIKKSEIPPAYFENIAKKNDENMMYKDQLSQKDYISLKILENIKDNNKKHYRSEVQKRLPIITRTQKAKTIRSNTETPNQIITILGCNLGALSNAEIKEKLEEKQVNEQKENLKKNRTLVFTEESQIVSEIDTKLQTNREDFFIKDDRRKGKKTLKQKQKINWNMMPNEKFKIALQKILELQQNQSFLKNSQKQFSMGEQYWQKQQQMLQICQIYRPKQYIMKHKLQWKL